MKVEILNTEIFELKRKIIDNKFSILKNKEGFGLYEKKMMGEIADELLPDQKPKFSNEAKRLAEFDRRTQTDKDYVSLREYIVKLERERDELYSQLDYKQNLFLIEMEKLKLGISEKI